MLGTDGSSDEDSSDSEAHNLGSKKSKPVSGDDLGDSFSVDTEISNKKGWVDDIYEKEDAGDQDEDGTNSEGSENDEDDQEGSVDEDDSDDDDDDNTTGTELGNMSSMKDWEQSDDDDLDLDAEKADDADEMELVRKNMNTRKMESIGSRQSSSAGKHAPLQQEALPFVIDAPNNLAELCSLLDGRSDGEVVEAINRIRACNSIRLSDKNRSKMQVCFCTTLSSDLLIHLTRTLISLFGVVISMRKNTKFVVFSIMTTVFMI